MKFACEKCGQLFDYELQCRQHEEEHRKKDTPALGEKVIQEFTVSLTEHPSQGEGKYTFTYTNGKKSDSSGHPGFFSNIKNMDRLVGKKVRVTCYAEIIN